MEKGAVARRPRRLRLVLFAIGSLMTLAGTVVLTLPAQAWEGAQLDMQVNCDRGVVNFLGSHFGKESQGRLHIEYPPSNEVFTTPWHYTPGGPDTQVIATMTIDQMSKQAGKPPPFDVWASLEEDEEVMVDETVAPCGEVSPTPTIRPTPTVTPSGAVSPTITPTTTPSGGVSPTATVGTPSPFGSVLPTQAGTTPSPFGGVLAESVGLPNTGVPRNTLFTIAGTLIAFGLMLLALSAMLWRRPVTERA
jgi:hypothetical protein